MAAPNVVNVTSIYGKTMGSPLSTSSADMLTCPTDKLLKINSIIVASIDAGNNADVTVAFYNAGDTTAYHLAKLVTVPAKSTLEIIGVRDSTTSLGFNNCPLFISIIESAFEGITK